MISDKKDIVTPDASSVEQTLEKASTVKIGFRLRVLNAIRSRVRRLFKKEDPNIYPFF